MGTRLKAELQRLQYIWQMADRIVDTKEIFPMKSMGCAFAGVPVPTPFEDSGRATPGRFLPAARLKLN